MAAERAQPANVGILAVEVYFPSNCVTHEDLERHNGVPAGKYTLGLGQQALSYCGDREDAVSMGLTALRRLMDRHGVAAAAIGRLEVGTESSPDASKSIKSHLMGELRAEDPDATDVEGVDCVHACYGGTAALQNAANWVESRAWDGRAAVVVMTDASVYSPGGAARPTSGAGAVALLVGPDAPLALERGLAATHFVDAVDFCKPSGRLFPQIDGPASVRSYLEGLDATYPRYCRRFAARHGRPFALADAAFALFHAPYHRLVHTAFARLTYLEMCRAAGPAACPLGEGHHPLAPASMPKDLERALRVHCDLEFGRKVGPSTSMARLCGNLYTASLWAGVAQLVETRGAALEGARLLLYSYGSGAAATMLSAVGRRVEGAHALERLQGMSDLAVRLAARAVRPPADFERAMAAAERRHGAAPYRPQQPVEELRPGTYYLEEVDERWRRIYARRPPVSETEPEPPGGAQGPSAAVLSSFA